MFGAPDGLPPFCPWFIDRSPSENDKVSRNQDQLAALSFGDIRFNMTTFKTSQMCKTLVGGAK
jgi:hypothetical protein